MKITTRSFALLASTVVVMASCHSEKKEAHTAAALPEVEATTVKSLQPQLQTVLPGELKPWNKTHIFPRVKGYVGSVKADRGTVVKHGDVLAVLEAPEIVSALNHAQAQVASAQATLIEQRARMRASTLTYKRMVETSRTKGAVSANEMDVALSRMSADSALTNAAQSNLLAAKAQHASQSQLVSYLTVRAPFDGTVTERNISPGELVGPEGNTKPLFVLEDHSKLRLTVAVPENLSNSITNNSAVTFTVQADPQKEYRAVFARSANSLSENNRTMMAEFDLENPGGALKAGMYAEVKLPVTRNKATLFVPRTALLQSTEGVFVIRLKEHVAEWLGVQKGNTMDSLVEVFGPLQAGESIVLRASEELRNGQAVTVKAEKLSQKK
ncbi:efflux RND transporter periplasmic adaptor subunit [Chryseolinea lacunae]|uniref:Efflux RND transporter periplasmic adaptor subunit n=1 Tax=Chryseolinea lacunae TaxID=2801331 RepID=A0ABS1KP23_9BACT|nr:efflux RND transporter periplasmic adaptor subunit [Chryseolinea lacunae]MBL0741176.1 efflux RND transporter periplasmic adaptor subunit [Chryseolinea lacunae]